MRKIGLLMVVIVLLSGCGVKNYEIRNATCDAEYPPVAGIISINATDDMIAPVISTQEGDMFYMADGYEVTLQTLQGGDVNATFRSCTGFDSSRLTVVETQQDGLKRYDCAWSSTGEGIQTVSRMTILDDGSYHYVLTVMAQGDWDEEVSAAWQQLSDSFRVNIVQ